MADDASPDPSRDQPSDLEKPYRTPVEISQEAIPEVAASSRRLWLGVVAVLFLAGGVAAYSYRQASFIQNFGNLNRRPVDVDDLQVDDVDLDFSAATVEEHVREFGLRRSYPVQVPFDETASDGSKVEGSYTVKVPEHSSQGAAPRNSLQQQIAQP